MEFDAICCPFEQHVVPLSHRPNASPDFRSKPRRLSRSERIFQTVKPVIPSFIEAAGIVPLSFVTTHLPIRAKRTPIIQLITPTFPGSQYIGANK